MSPSGAHGPKTADHYGRTEAILRQHWKGADPVQNREALTEEFLPQNLPYRDREGDAIARILAPSLWKQKPSNALIYGNPGTGKTAVTRLVLRQLQDEADRPVLPGRLPSLRSAWPGPLGKSDRTQRFRRGIGDSMHAHGDFTQHRKPDTVEVRALQLDAREGQAGLCRVAERSV